MREMEIPSSYYPTIVSALTTTEAMNKRFNKGAASSSVGTASEPSLPTRWMLRRPLCSC